MRRLLAIAALGLACASAGGQGDELARARAAVERQDYAAALAAYEAVLGARGHDADLLIEVARVHGWADRNGDAARLYRRALELAPGRRADILPALAWQTLWSGQAQAARPLFAELAGSARADRADALDGLGQALQALDDHAAALPVLREAVALAPSNLRLRRRLALALLWTGRETEAVTELESLQARAPSDRDLSWSLANARNFAGRHRAALREFSRWPAPTVPGERADLARAWRWAGYADRAAPWLADARDAESAWLRDWRVRRELAPYGYATADRVEDRDALVVRTSIVGAGWHPAPGATIEFTGRRPDLRDPIGSADANEFQVSVGWRIGEPGAGAGTWWPSIALRNSRHAGWSPWQPQLRLRGVPEDGWRVDAEAVRELVEAPRAIAERVTVDLLGAGVEHRPDPRWRLAGSVALLRFDDGTRRLRLSGSADRVLLTRPRVTLGVEAMGFERDADTSVDRGYWNPRRYAEARAALTIAHERRPFELKAKLGIGRSREVDGGGVVTRGRPDLWELGLWWDASPGLQLRLGVGGSGAGGGLSGGGAGYWRRYASIGVNAWW